MSPKPPSRGIATVDVHPRPFDPTIGHTPRPVVLSGDVPARALQTPGRTPTGADLDEITPAPPVTISLSPSASIARPMSEKQPLEHYWVSAETRLPDPDVQGFRTFKGRRYVDVPDGGIVHVVTDPETGLYRARLPSELAPSGPVLVRDPESRLWHPLEGFKPITFPLSDTRLEAFSIDLDFTGVEPDRDGLYRHNGKLYVVIGKHAYQALHDLDASSPPVPVMRIVRPEDHVAGDAANIYVGTRAGRSEPIVFDVQHGWMGTLVGGAGGMRRRANPVEAIRTADLAFELRVLDLEFEQAMATAGQLETRWEAAKGTEGERNALELLKEQHQRELAILEKTVNLHTDQKEAIVAIKGRIAYRNKIVMLQKGRILTYSQLMIASDSRKLLDGPIFGGPAEEHLAVAAHLSSKLVIMKKRQQIADELVKKWRLSQSELKEAAFDQIEMHETVAFWIYAKSRLLIDIDTAVNANARYLAFSFGQVTFAFRALENIPPDARIPVLSDLLDQTSAIRVSYENLELPPGLQHVSSRGEITEAIQDFENTLDELLNRYHQEQAKTSALPPHEQPIDFDFIPAQGQNHQASTPRKMFRSKHHGVYKIHVGRPRRTASGEDVIDVMNPHNPTEVLQTYERREGEWRRLVARQERNLSTLTTQAKRLLDQSDAHLNTAWQDERAKRNATSIVEFLADRAEHLDDLAQQIGRAPNPGAIDIDPLVQRLKHDSQRLLNEGEDIRLRLYKDKSYLSVDRVAFLISHGHLSVTKTHTRLSQGKGNKKHFLDVYELNDKQTGTTLWHAHFHYEEKNSPALDFMVKGGHLKTLEQSRLGTSSQRRDEQAGRAHVRIWREDIDSRTAQRIFNLVS